MRCRCAETDAEVQRCLSSLRRSVDVVPDSRSCRRSSDGFVTAHRHPAEPVDDVSVSTSQTTESAETATSSGPPSFPPQQDAINFDIRNYLIDRCVTDTHHAAATAAAGDNEDDCDGIIGDDNADKNPSSAVLDLPQDSCERSTTPPPLIFPSKRYSDTELVKRSHLPAVTGSATLPARAASIPGGTDSRVKRHRWKLLRKALNLFSFDESTVDDDDDDVATTVRGGGGGDDDAGNAVDDGGTDVDRTVRDDADDGADGVVEDGAARTVRGDDGGSAGEDGDHGQSDGGTAQSGEEQPQRHHARSISVESLPGSVPATRQISHHHHHHHHHY